MCSNRLTCSEIECLQKHKWPHSINDWAFFLSQDLIALRFVKRKNTLFGILKGKQFTVSHHAGRRFYPLKKCSCIPIHFSHKTTKKVTENCHEKIFCENILFP